MTATQAMLMDVYRSLAPDHRDTVELIAVSSKPVHRTTVHQTAKKMGRQFSVGAWAKIVNDLLQGRLLKNVSGQIEVNPAISEIILRTLDIEGRLLELLRAVEPIVVQRLTGSLPEYLAYRQIDQIKEDLRWAIYLDEPAQFADALSAWSSFYPSWGSPHQVYERVFTNPFDADWLGTKCEVIRSAALDYIIPSLQAQLLPANAAIELLRKTEGELAPRHWLKELILRQDLMTGEFGRAAESLAAGDDAAAIALYQGWIACAKGESELAVGRFEAAIKQLKRETRKRDIVLPPLLGAFYVLALLGTRDALRIRQARKYLTAATHRDPQNAPLLQALICAADLAEGRGASAREVATKAGLELVSVFDWLFIYTVLFWVDAEAAKSNYRAINALRQRAAAGGYCWLETELSSLLDRLRPDLTNKHVPTKTHQEMGTAPIIEIIRQEEPWERSLRALERMSKIVKADTKPSAASSRMTWRIGLSGQRPVSLAPIEQKLGKAGQWSKGRVVGLKRLHAHNNMPHLTTHDLRICATLISGQTYYSSQDEIYFDFPKALAALIGHPLVFREDSPKTRVDVVAAEPQLRVTSKGRQVRITMVPAPPEGSDIVAVIKSPTRLAVSVFGPQHHEISDVIGEKGLAVPAGAKDKVAQAVSSVSALLTVHSDLVSGETDARTVPADATPHLHLTPYEDGLRVEPLVQPFVGEGPTHRPGEGGEVVFAIVSGHRSRAHRNRAEEKRRLEEVKRLCRSLNHASWDGSGWTLPDPEACLELLDELHALGDKVVVTWPQGEVMKIGHRATLDRLALKICKKRDWFSIEGDVKLDSGLVMGLRELLERIESAPGRFLELGDKEFVALTDRFRQRAAELGAYVDRHGKGLRFHPSRAHALEALVEDAGAVDGDSEWLERLRRFRDAQALDPPLPSTLHAELRDYQEQGFRWAARLAEWGAGACLADDMGLGKTVQALAVALAHAPAGPTLVVAPTSICANWIDEARRFTPTLVPLLFGPGNRETMLKEIGPYHIAVCSYGLLHTEVDRLAAVSWETVILDEAQAIKNRDTMRSRAAMQLNGAFRMITTGTPIENHLGELWNLFQFINPGLLGSFEAFAAKFATPIHQHGSSDAKSRLKRLIQPFILRRTKTAVLDELPPRTEITIRVAMKDDERALYEALRQRAVEALEDEDAQAGKSHFRILAEIMKLRRACCHPQLVAPETDLPGSKLEAFAYTVDELRENGHKALVFSQFVDHLRIVRAHLDERGISYRYLDGSTPARQRKVEVDAFQAGEGDLFLISLRAGGQGLNLTAADYVLHMDPWWNPAVEDQASDRAHRIGQIRPVTIYRFVMKDTIEEKIVGLHASKRDLADNLLEGADMSGKMSADQLLALIREV